MSISFSVHELNPHMQKSPIYVIGTLWMDEKGVWLLDRDDLPAVEIVDGEACEQLRAKLAPARDALYECLIYTWLVGQPQQWALDRLYWIHLQELESCDYSWPIQIPIRQVPPEYETAH
jgi:hypothetical protein